MGRYSNSTEMLLSMRGTTLIWVTDPSLHLCATSSALESEDRWCTIAPSSLQTMRGFVRYKHPQQLPLCPMRLLIEVCCPLSRIRGAAATPHRSGALLSELILA